MTATADHGDQRQRDRIALRARTRGDEPVVWYDGSGTSSRRWLHADEHGSIVAITDESGAATLP